MQRVVSALTLFQGPLSADQVSEFTSGHGVSVDGVTLKDAGIEAATLQLTTGAGDNLYLKSDASGHASWSAAPSRAESMVEVTAYPYTITSTPQGSVFIANPSSPSVINLPTLSAATYGSVLRIYNVNATNSVTVNRGGSDTLWDGSLVSVTVSPNSRLVLLGGTANFPRWLQA